MMGGQSLSYATPKTRIGQLVCDWIQWSETAERQPQHAYLANSFMSRTRPLSTSNPGSPDGGHDMDWQGPETEATSLPTPANSTRVEEESEASQSSSSAPGQDAQSMRERSPSIQSSVSTTPSIVPDPHYHDGASPAKKTFGLPKERGVSLSGVRLPSAQPDAMPLRYPKTPTHTKIVDKELTFSQRAFSNLLTGSGRSVSGPAQSYFSMMRRTTQENLPRNAAGFDSRIPPSTTVDGGKKSTGAPDDDSMSTSEDD